MKLVANYYTKKYGYPPVLVDVGAIQLDILPFTLGFFEAVLFREIECEAAFDEYIQTCAQMATRLIYEMSKIELTDKEIRHIEAELFVRIVERACKGKFAIA